MKPLQMPLFAPDSEWAPPEMSDLPDWARAERVAIDTETRDPHLKTLGPGVRRDDSYVVGISFALEPGGQAFYLPIRHEGGDNMDCEAVLAYLRDQARRFTGEVVGANLSYDLDFLAQEGIWFESCEAFRDVQIGDPLVYELHNSYSLQNIAERYGMAGKDTALLDQAARSYGVDPKGGMWRLPARYVGPYATEDARLPLRLIRRIEREIDDQDLWDIYNLESQVLPVLVKMRRRGVRIDQERLDGIEAWSLEQEAEALARVRALTGVSIDVGDVWSPEPLVPALEFIGLDLPRTKTGQPSVAQEVLEHVDHDVARSIIWARKVNKLRTTFASSIRTHMINGRIHCTFNQLPRDSEKGGIRGARFGRLSSENPNMQQQPSRDEFAARWRSIYRPDSEWWACLDYSQQEPRWLTHYAELRGKARAAEAAEAYRSDPTTDNHTMMAELTGLPRKSAKIVYLGLCYSMGGAKLCRDLGLPTRWCLTGKRVVHLEKGSQERFHREFFETQDEASEAASTVNNPRIFEAAGVDGQHILDEFNRKAPFVKDMAGELENYAKQRGWIKTAGGRLCRFPKDKSGNYDWTHKALNRLIQGSSADQTKRAMVELDRAGHELQLQVHDEFDYSPESLDQAREAAEIMRNCMSASVPFRVDVEVGPSWGEIRDIEEVTS